MHDKVINLDLKEETFKVFNTILIAGIKQGISIAGKGIQFHEKERIVKEVQTMAMNNENIKNFNKEFTELTLAIVDKVFTEVNNVLGQQPLYDKDGNKVNNYFKVSNK
ncbi:hypothetical protein KNV05_gp129 [Vibrio phage River4]|uniref:Uncharacterized protein n=1 Tax=Vibrio phage River4 TaxID=2736288 RepID=A0A6M9Z0C3_9CAUD|nr:hypothetical protein KNV05_gp129 [Vibrio phage River4]QKN84826.1 hypothetical protein RIVER4_187 [Vibrio phage River4]